MGNFKITALETLKSIHTDRELPHFNHEYFLKYAGGLSNEFGEIYHDQLSEILTDFRLLNRSKSNRQSKTQIRQEVRTIVETAKNYPNGIASVFKIFKDLGVELSKTEKRNLIWIDPKKRPPSNQELWLDACQFVQDYQGEILESQGINAYPDIETVLNSNSVNITNNALLAQEFWADCSMPSIGINFNSQNITLEVAARLYDMRPDSDKLPETIVFVDDLKQPSKSLGRAFEITKGIVDDRGYDDIKIGFTSVAAQFQEYAGGWL